MQNIALSTPCLAVWVAAVIGKAQFVPAGFGIQHPQLIDTKEVAVVASVVGLSPAVGLCLTQHLPNILPQEVSLARALT